MATKKVIDYRRGSAVNGRTGDVTAVRVTGGRQMTVAFHAPLGALRRAEYPAYVLESTDGEYRRRLTPKDDLVPGDDVLQLAFTGLAQGKRYTLRCEHGPEQAPQTIFADAPYDSIVDGAHAYHDELDDHLLGGPEEGP